MGRSPVLTLTKIDLQKKKKKEKKKKWRLIKVTRI